MKLSIIIPVYNEEKTVGEIINRVRAVNIRGISKEVIVVDDASKDRSFNIIKKFPNIKVIRHSKNQGKGAAIKSGLSKVTGEFVLIQDADLEYDPQDYRRLLQPLLSKKAKVVYGTRLKNYPIKVLGNKHTPFLSHYLGNKFLTTVTNLLYGSELTDMETCYKVFSADIVEVLELMSKRFEFEPEVTAKILKKGYSIYEVPIKVSPRGYDEGKKITWRDGFVALWVLVKYRFFD